MSSISHAKMTDGIRCQITGVNVRIALRISTAKLAFAFTVSCLTSEIQGMDVSISATYNGNVSGMIGNIIIEYSCIT